MQRVEGLLRKNVVRPASINKLAAGFGSLINQFIAIAALGIVGGNAVFGVAFSGFAALLLQCRSNHFRGGGKRAEIVMLNVHILSKGQGT